MRMIHLTIPPPWAGLLDLYLETRRQTQKETIVAFGIPVIVDDTVPPSLLVVKSKDEIVALRLETE